MSDLISRQAAKEAYCKHFCHLYCYRDTLCSDNLCKEVNEVFDKLPSAQPEHKIGRWINTEPNYKSGFGNNAHYCSVCKGYYTTSPSEMHYCPNCGAKMEGEFDEQ